jgi:single-strand DNA-binding protein
MAVVNKVILIGNVGRDPEIRYLNNGDAATNFSLATTEKWKDKNGEQHEETQWHRISAFGRLAEICGEYIKKGTPIYVEGKIKYGKYTDQAGVEKNTVEIVMKELQLLGGRDGGRNEGSEQAPRQQAAPQRQAPQRQQSEANRSSAPAQRQQPQRQAAPAHSFSDMDDDQDIPF